MLFLHPYFRGAMAVAHRIIPVGCVLFFLGIVWFNLGAGINIPALVWHHNPPLQASCGFAIALLFAYVWLVTYILDARFNREFIGTAVRRSRRSIAFRIISFLLPSTHPETGPSPEAVDLREGGDGLRWYLGVTFFPCTFLLILPAFFAVQFESPFVSFSDPDAIPAGRLYIADRWPFLVGVAGALAALPLLTRVGNAVRSRLASSDRRQRLAHEYWLQTLAAMLLTGLILLYLVLWFLVERNLWQPPPVAAVCMLFGMIVGVAGAVWFHLRFAAIPILIAMIVWMSYCNRPDYKLRFPHMEPEYAAILDLEDFEEPAFSLAEVVADEANPDLRSAQRAEAERVLRLVANLQSQRDPRTGVDERLAAMRRARADSLENYDRLARQYAIELQLLDREEQNALRSWRNQFRGSVPNDSNEPTDTKQPTDMKQPPGPKGPKGTTDGKGAIEPKQPKGPKGPNEGKGSIEPKQPKGSNAAERPKLVLVTATGGANRSGLWTAKVLYELHNDRRLGGFSRNLRLITGASGGMVGASYYVGSLQSDGTLQEGFQPEDIAQDFLTPIINSLVFRELPMLAAPIDHYDRDRGEMLDRAMEGEVPNIDPGVRKRLNNVFSKTFAEMADGEREGWRPSMIFSPMIVEDGRRLLISNRHVPFLTVSKGDFLLPNRTTFGVPENNVGNKRLETAQRKNVSSKRGRSTDESGDVYSRPAVEFFRLFPEARNRFHLSTAARMNATFPFLSPAVSLPTQAPRRIVDAGYFDNTGVSIATAWLYQYREWIARNCSGVVIIQIRDFASHRENRHLSMPPMEGGSFLPGLTGPLSAVDHARSASANYRNDDDLRRLSEYFRTFFKANAALSPVTGTNQFFTTVVFERYTDVGMNWFLSPRDKQDILDSWDKGSGNMNPASLQKLQEWWSQH